MPLQADHERQVLPDPRIDRRVRGGAAERRLGIAQILGSAYDSPRLDKIDGSSGAIFSAVR